MKIDKTVRKETCYIAAGTIVLGALMQAVYLLIGRWDLPILFGGLLGMFAAVLNFFLMGLTVQAAVLMEPEDAKKRIRVSQSGRNMLLLVFAVLGAALPCFDLLSVLIPLFFPRVVIVIRSFTLKKEEGGAPLA